VVGHAKLAQSPPLQSTSHSHELAQSTAPHAFEPLQSTSQSPVPQSMLPHALDPSQRMSHAPATLQSIVPHALLVVQSMLQS
jgi:hypothetical protein